MNAIKRLLFRPDIRQVMLLFLMMVTVAAALVSHRAITLLEAGIMIGVYTASDIALLGFVTKKFVKPVTAGISALILVCVLTPTLPPLLWILAPLVASISKRLLRFNKRLIFNPAAFSMGVMSLFFPHIIGWWVGLNQWLTIVLLIFGCYIWWRLNKWQTVLAFAAGYYLPLVLLFGVSVVIPPWADPTVLFFTAIMLIEPVSGAYRHKSVRVLFGGLVGAAAVVYAFIPNFPIDIFVAALLTGNLLASLADRGPKNLFP